MKSVRRALVCAVVSMSVLLGGPVTQASAHHPEISASMSCSGLVSYTATAWSDSDPARRTNNAVTVRIGGTTIGTGAFTSGNGFTFSGTHQLATPLPGSIVVTAVTGPWGPNGEFGSSGSSTSTGSITIAPCPAQPAATIADVDCTAGGSLVTLINTGGEDATFTITVDGAAFDTITVAGGATATRTVSVAEDATAAISVSATGMTTVSSSAHRDCVPGATVGAIDCTLGGSIVTLTNTGGQPATFAISVNGQDRHTVVVAAGGTDGILIPIAEDSLAVIDVTSPGMGTVTGTLLRNCDPDVAPVLPPLTPPMTPILTDPIIGPDGPTETPVAVDDVADDANAVEELEADDTTADAAAGDLPFTGSDATTPVAITGWLTLLLGIGLFAWSGRARTRRSPVR